MSGSSTSIVWATSFSPYHCLDGFIACRSDSCRVGLVGVDLVGLDRLRHQTAIDLADIGQGLQRRIVVWLLADLGHEYAFAALGVHRWFHTRSDSLEKTAARLVVPVLQAHQRTIELLDDVGIVDAGRRLGDYPHQLSGGQRQRVMIAMALACNPQLMIADEPTTALDVTIQAQILDLMNKLKTDTGAAILFITHDLCVIAEMAQNVAVMYAGKVMEYTDVKSLYADPKNPYTIGLLQSIPVLGSKTKGHRLETISGVVPSLLNLPAGCLFSDRCSDVFDDCRRVAPKMYRVGKNHIVRCLKYA